MKLRSKDSFLLLILATGISSAQVATGTPPFGTFGGGPFDTVNLGDLNVHFAIPVLNKVGRGIPFVFNISYDSSLWTPVTSSGVTSWQPDSAWGWHSQTDAVTGYVPPPATTFEMIPCGQKPRNSWTTSTYSGFVDEFGTFHPVSGLFLQTGPSQCIINIFTATGTATDGSGYTVTVPSGVVVSREGKVFTVPVAFRKAAATFTDTNGNQITSTNGTTFFDTLSATTPVLTMSSTTPPTPTTFTYPGPSNGASNCNPITRCVSYTMNYLQYTVKTSFGVTGVSEYGPLTNSLVSSIVAPDGSSYAFSYEQTPSSCTPNAGTQPTCVTGRIKQITLPTGGTITYTYSGGNNGIEPDGTTAGLTRLVNPGGQWQYSRTAGTGKLWTTTVTDANSNQTVFNFSEDNNSTNPSQNFYETQRQVYQGSSTAGTLLQTVLTCYNGLTQFGCAVAARSVSSPIIQTDVFSQIPNGSSTKTSLSETVYDSSGLGLVQEQSTYDYGVTFGHIPAANLLLRRTDVTYASLGTILGRPSSVTVSDVNSRKLSSTTYTYDEGSVSTTTNTPQHQAVTGSRGNPTTVSDFVSTTATLTSHFTYDDTGNVTTSTDVNSALTTYKHGACGNSFLTEVDLPLGLTNFFSWDTNCTGGVMVQSKDANGNATNYSFNDPNFWRMTNISYPDGGSIAITYNEGTHSPWDIATSTAQDGATNVTTDTVFDGLGRATKQELTSDPSGTDFVVTTYDPIGRVASVTNPYRTANDQTYGLTQYSYDPLDRAIAVTNPDNSVLSFSYTGAATQLQDEGNNSGGTTHITKVYQADAIGRLISVCEVSATTVQGGAGTPVACGQDMAATGFLTSYAYDALGNIISVSQPGVNARTYSYDGLSRVTQEINPESGTTTYTYDHSGQQGDLYQRTRPKPNQTGSTTVVTTYTLDALHRLTGRSYNDGSTPSASLSYDQTTVGGVSPQNPKGQLTNVVVAGNVAGTIFSYDKMGRTGQEWQCTPLNCGTGTFSMQYAYDFLGDVTQLVNSREGVTYSYSYDPAARLTKLQSSLSDSNHPATLLTVNTYNPLGEVQHATLGNGIVRNLQYDNRGRITSLTDGSIYNFSLGYAPDSNLLAANDSVNGNWSYTSDAVGRIATASKSGQAFSYNYDPAGNRWKQNVTTGTGPNPQYSVDANNHIVGYSYDAAGNLLSDTFHSYTYDAEGRLLTVDGTVASYTYDAFGQRVRTTVNGTLYDFVYNAGQAVDKVAGSAWLWGHAGGAAGITYTNGTTYFDHADWAGTVRARSGVSGASVETCTSLSFGDNQNCVGTDWSPLHFAGLTGDSESNLQQATFRQLSTAEGRWTVPDPLGMGVPHPTNPQTWNRYTYVANNPTGFIDPLGLDFTCFTGIFYVYNDEGIDGYKIIDVCGDGGDFLGGGGGGGVGGGNGSPCPLSVGIVFPNGTSQSLQIGIETALHNLFGPNMSLNFVVNGIGQVNLNIGGIVPAPGTAQAPEGLGGYVPQQPNGQPFNYGFVDFGQVASAQNWRVAGRTNTLATAVAQVGAHELGHELYLPDNPLGGIMVSGQDPFVPLQFTFTGKINLVSRCQFLLEQQKK